MTGLTVSVCRACGWRGFPERLWCPRCGSAELDAEPVRDGRLEEATTLVQAPGRRVAAPVRIATVRLAGGGRAVARLEADGPDVVLDVDDGAPVACPANERPRGA